MLIYHKILSFMIHKKDKLSFITLPVSPHFAIWCLLYLFPGKAKPNSTMPLALPADRGSKFNNMTISTNPKFNTMMMTSEHSNEVSPFKLSTDRRLTSHSYSCVSCAEDATPQTSPSYDVPTLYSNLRI